MEIIHYIAQAAGAAFFLFIASGAYLIISDSDKRWKERYGNRWIMSKSERARLDKAYAERIENKKAS